MEEKLKEIARNFAFEGPVERIAPLGEGFINDTFIVRTAPGHPDYILQRKNGNIFTDVPSMMDNISRVTAHMRRRVVEAGGNPEREVMRVEATTDGKLCHRDSEGHFWAATIFIDNTIAYNKADSTALARKGGEGIGRFQALLADFDEPLAETIKGFHNIRYRFMQWDDSLNRDAARRAKDLAAEIDWIEQRRPQMLKYWELVEKGTIPARVTHNDTKINNILFDHNGDVLCAIDLDTVMSAPALNDFGDAIRSYTNTGEEDDKDISKVSMSLPMMEAYADGYLSQMAKQLTEAELDWLAFSALYITYEQVLRFLMDYIDGDKYYKIKYPEHNLVRTHAQMALMEDMERKYPQMQEIIKNLTLKYK